MSSKRYVLIVSHTRREDAQNAARQVTEQLQLAGIVPVFPQQELSELQAAELEAGVAQSALETASVLGTDCQIEDLELVIVLGGDGTILKAAEIVRATATPLLGINLGHVGFLAESERDGLDDAVKRVVAKDYLIKERLTLDVGVYVEGKEVFRTWALNEATIEKSSTEKMLEVVVEIDRKPLTSFGCDGIILGTPTGSTAYAFSAGGPVIWPSVEAITVVPLSAHALFARPLVVSPRATIAVEVLHRSNGSGVLWADGRRTWHLPPGARVEAKRSALPVRLARFRQGPFNDRLVKKFSLPVDGWRGPAEGN
jgi:NAD+ kinase